jgi:hypothetical protein
MELVWPVTTANTSGLSKDDVLSRSMGNLQ